MVCERDVYSFSGVLTRDCLQWVHPHALNPLEGPEKLQRQHGSTLNGKIVIAKDDRPPYQVNVVLGVFSPIHAGRTAQEMLL